MNDQHLPASINSQIDRRSLLRFIGLGAGASFIAACAGKATPAATSINPATAATAIATPGAVGAAPPSVGANVGRFPDFSKIELATEQLAPNFYTVTWLPGLDPTTGGRVGFLAGQDGIFMIDSQFAPLTDKIVAEIRKVSNAPLRFLVNTHEHPDHTGGNANFAHLGALIIAREEVRTELTEPLPSLVGEAANGTDPVRLPVLTYGLEAAPRFRLNNETIDLIPVAPGHTDGDTIVRFENADLMMVGDFYWSYGYPFVDQTHGGSIEGILAALDTVLKFAGPSTKIVPGHGPVVGRDAIPAHRDIILNVQGTVQALFAQGRTLQEVVDTKPTAAFDASVPGAFAAGPPGPGTTADRFVSEIYAELKAGG